MEGSSFCGFNPGMLSVFVILTKYLSKTFATLYLSDFECFFSINVMSFSAKKGFAELSKVFTYLNGLIKTALLKQPY